MKIKSLYTFAFCLLPFAFFISCFAQGSLTPPGAPAPTMKSLDQVEPRMPIASLPFFIANPGAYYLTTNLTGISGTNGITIAANDVMLDLRGFSLVGVSGSLSGVKVSASNFANDAHTNLFIANGVIRNWDANGINAGQAYNCRFDNLQLSTNKVDGLNCGDYTLVTHCLAFGNGSYGFESFDSLFEDCCASLNNNDGFHASHSRVVNCVSQGNGASGISAFNGSSVSDCRVADNSGSGIALGRDSIARDNHCDSNDTSAIALRGGIEAFLPDAVIQGNHIRFSAGFGVLVDTGVTNVVVVQNILAGTTNNAFSIPPGNDVGPTNRASNATSPWANIVNP